jgi:hypothetical protein
MLKINQSFEKNDLLGYFPGGRILCSAFSEEGSISA